MEIGGVAVEEGKIGPGGVARGEMVKRSTRGAQIVEWIRAVKRNLAGIGPHVREKNERRGMSDGSGFEGRTGGNQAVGAFEIDAITECHAIQRVHFPRKDRSNGYCPGHNHWVPRACYWEC